MSGEEKLRARAEELDETSELAMALEGIHANAALAGVQREAVRSLEAALSVLGEPVPAYDAGTPDDRHAGGGDYGSDVDFIEALIDAEEGIRDWLRAAVSLYSQAGEALGRALKDLEQARRDLADAYAMSTHKPCDGCHSAKAAAIAAAEAAIADAERRIAICEATGDILESLMERLRATLGRLCQVPQDLGECYQLIHAFIQAGGVMPKPGRWVTGAPAGDRARHDGGRPPAQPQPASPAPSQGRGGTATFSIVQADLLRKAGRALDDALRAQANGDHEQADRDFAASRGYRAEAAECQLRGT